MAITKTRTVGRIEVYGGDDPVRVTVFYNIVMDDADDDELPVTSSKIVHLEKLTWDNSDPDNPVSSPTDISGEDALVQTVCNAVWS